MVALYETIIFFFYRSYSSWRKVVEHYYTIRSLLGECYSMSVITTIRVCKEASFTHVESSLWDCRNWIIVCFYNEEEPFVP